LVRPEDGVAAFAASPRPQKALRAMVGAGFGRERAGPGLQTCSPQQWTPPKPWPRHRTTGQRRTWWCGPTARTAFQFIGRMGDRDDLQVFLQSGEKLYVVRQGDVIEDTYRLDRVSASELSLVYLPLHQSQTLSVGSAP
jgi:hypothetical protein